MDKQLFFVWIKQIKDGQSIIVHHMQTLQFPILCKNKTVLWHFNMLGIYIQAFDKSFQVNISKQKEVNIFVKPFKVEPVDVLDSLQHTLLQSNNGLKTVLVF